MPEPWRVVIADDEPDARLGVRQLLASYPRFTVAAECRNGGEVLASLDAIRPDVVFLDVQMPELTGFDVIQRRTPERMPAVVFLTAYDEFAVRAFEAQAMDYLLKPVTEARFNATMSRLERQLGAPREASIVVTTARSTMVVPLRDVDWIEAAGNYAQIWTGGKSYLLREPLAELEARVQSCGFLRAHRCALVRVDRVQRLVRGKDGGVIAVLRDGARVPVARRRRAAFVAAVRALAGGLPSTTQM